MSVAMIARLRDRRSSLSAIVPQSRGCSRWPRHWQTEQVTGQMATWREWRAWRREFKSLGIRQVKERNEARSIWHEEKQQAARWWLREQELLPYVITALATFIVGLIAWLK